MSKTTLSSMEPMLPSPLTGELQDLALELTDQAARLAGTLHTDVARAVGNLVRSMNCYYSNLIEGHDTHPRDIDRALKEDYSTEPRKRDLQLEARAHIRLQQLIDSSGTEENIVSAPYILWLHKEFHEHLPDDLLWVENPDTGEKVNVTPGKFRDRDVIVGRLIPIETTLIGRFLQRFEDAYRIDRLGRMERLIGAAASHHRLLWIHPFLDGNGRVTRLLSHAYLKQIGLGSSLWSVARGLARNVEAYKSALSAADSPRQGDLDGRGNLSERGLTNFCLFFLRTCIDQVNYMESLIRPAELLNRMEVYIQEEINAKRLPQGAFPLLREAVLAGSFERGKAKELTGYKDRQARIVLKTLLDKELLTSTTERGRVSIGFPQPIVDRLFPGLYPT
ncbi:MAG TPA: Fic family protein [Gammaproteobacteria bacterium]|nr:Fic family protein [Gammaproteobacteria bacterium]